MTAKLRTRQSGLADITYGDNVLVVEPCNLYGCTLGDEVFVGPFVEIQKTSPSAPAARFSRTVFSVNT
ncbi:hypothetical protein GGER_14260 [Serratia rubidaea]